MKGCLAMSCRQPFMAPLFGFLITVALPTVRAIRGSGVASAQGDYGGIRPRLFFVLCRIGDETVAELSLFDRGDIS